MRRVVPKLLAPAFAAVALIAPPSAAAQGAPCWRQVINDWWDNGRVDRVYAPECYREALARLPEDMQAYSDAPDAIERALREAIRLRSQRRPQGEDGGRSRQDEPAPRTGPPASQGAGGGDDRFGEGRDDGNDFGDARDGSEDFDGDFDSQDGSSSDGGSGGNAGGGGGGAGGGDGDGDSAGSARPSDRPDEAEPSQGLFREALDRIGPNDPSSFPLPLLVLAAIALLLLTLATAAFLSRRLHARGLRLFGK